jgi:hypothetical protein
MERNYKTLITFFVAVSVISMLGFFTSYLSAFPQYGKFPVVIHIHFIAFLCWLALTIIQPVLIKKKNFSLHRKLGTFSYFIAPVMVVTMAILIITKVKRLLLNSPDDAIVEAFIGLLDVVSFTTYYIVAMLNRRNVRWHVAFIVSATLIVLNPGMARLLNQVQPGLGMLGAVVIPFVVPLCVILYEKISLKKPIFKSPYALFFLCWALEIVLLIMVPQTDFWKGIVEGLR